MSEIIAETNGKQGILLADTMVTRLDENGNIEDQYNKRKIYGTHRNKLIMGCVGDVETNLNIVDELENMSSIMSEDIYRIYDKRLSERIEQTKKDKNNTVFGMYLDNDKVRMFYCMKNSKNTAYELKNQKIVVTPGDSQHMPYLVKCHTGKICTKEHMIELVEEFIDISEKSRFVSDICCIATMNSWGIIQYYEANMYEMLKNIEEGKMKSDIGILAQSLPKFMRNGVQKPIK